MVLTFFAHSTSLETTNSGSAAVEVFVHQLMPTAAEVAAAADG